STATARSDARPRARPGRARGRCHRGAGAGGLPEEVRRMRRGTVRWVDGSHYVGANDLGLEVAFQGPPREGETRTAPSPKDLVLIGLGGCTAVDVVEILHKMRQPL